MSTSNIVNIVGISNELNPVVQPTDASHVSVVVNLRASISASANVTVFGPSQDDVSNVIWCDVSLNVKSLYDNSSNAMFEFWEPANARNEIRAQVASGRDASNCADLFHASMDAVLNGGLDASAANPFQGYKAAASEYYHYNTFGELALSYAAEGMFGHPSASVAITNDTQIVAGFELNDQTLPSVEEAPHDIDGQALAQRLAYKLLNSDPATARAIAEVVLAQDARRATNEDNSELQVDHKVPLRFYVGDVVYVQITLDGWTATNGNGNSGFLNQAFIPASLKTQHYYLRINLDHIGA